MIHALKMLLNKRPGCFVICDRLVITTELDYVEPNVEILKHPCFILKISEI